MNRIGKITIILANLVTVIQKRGDYNLDEYSNKIAALYSSQEPQKSEKQKVADLLGVPLSEVHTLDIQDGKLVEIVDVGKCIPIPESDEDIRKSERMKIGSWLENETRGVNFGAWAYWWNSVIAKLKSGQKSEG